MVSFTVFFTVMVFMVGIVSALIGIIYRSLIKRIESLENAQSESTAFREDLKISITQIKTKLNILEL